MYGDPDELERIAASLRRDAAALREQGGDHRRAATTARWFSAAADEAKNSAQQHAHQVDQAADALVTAAARLEEHAESVRQTLARIAELEREVSDWFSSAAAQGRSFVERVVDGAGDVVERVVNQPPIWSTWSVTPSNLPPPGDKAWLDVGNYLTGKGVL